jgi:Transposase, Mutator family
VVATSYLLGVSTRRVEKLAASLGVVGLSKSQVSVMAGELDEMVDSFRNRPLDRGPYTFVQLAARNWKVREGQLDTIRDPGRASRLATTHRECRRIPPQQLRHRGRAEDE